MQYAWRCPVPLEKAAARDPHMQGTTSFPGDSMICVNVEGRRCLNEKLPYNELVYRMFEWDGVACEFPNRVLIQLWDARSQDALAGAREQQHRPRGLPPARLRAATLESLTDEIARRLAQVRELTGGLELAPGFCEQLRATIARWNELAAEGVDRDFHRGETVVEVEGFGGPVADEPGRRNRTMWPIADEGPYYAALVGGGTLDTKGGPKVTPDGEVVDDLDRPIRGLFGVGNCVAGPQARAYWAGGATLGPMIGLAYRAAARVHARATSRAGMPIRGCLPPLARGRRNARRRSRRAGRPRPVPGRLLLLRLVERPSARDADRRPGEGALVDDRRWRQAAWRTRRESSGANQRKNPSAPPTATIVVTGQIVAAPAASAKPTGVSGVRAERVEAEHAREEVLGHELGEQRRPGRGAEADPEAAPDRADHRQLVRAERASTRIPRSFSASAEKQITIRCLGGFQRAHTREPATIRRPRQAEQQPVRADASLVVVAHEVGMSDVNGAIVDRHHDERRPP